VTNLTIKGLLVLWNELAAAFYGKSPFGGNVAEIYVYTLLPRACRKEDVDTADVRVVERAAQSLLAVLECFSGMHDCSITIDGLPYQQALIRKPAETHRYHVTIERH
jgi:hypothetical protein